MSGITGMFGAGGWAGGGVGSSRKLCFGTFTRHGYLHLRLYRTLSDKSIFSNEKHTRTIIIFI